MRNVPQVPQAVRIITGLLQYTGLEDLMIDALQSMLALP